ncbi:MAG TPA: glycosyltransferase [Candidatus Kapabacteria bacterium]|nr:glycosyltransferase [Candidatus Kapabacteria bacterium]
MIKKADLVFASTEELETYLLGRKFDRKKVVRTNFAIENEAIIQAVRRPEYESDALFVGRINETKGIYDMLEVLNIVRQQYPHFRLSIMGEGDNNTKQKFRAKIYERKMDNNIFFWGYKNKQEKYDIIKSAKCFWFLSISKSESFGIALLEAVCSGIPAFCYNLPQFSRLYQNDEVNISPNGDFRQVAEKVIGLFRNGDFSNEKGKLLLGKYSWKKIAEIQYKNIKKLMDNCK